MKQNPLSIVSVEKKKNALSKEDRLLEAKARCERIWLNHPEKFDPSRTALGRDRIKKTLNTVREYLQIERRHCVDIGCGNGKLTTQYAEMGADIIGADIASNALKLVPEKLKTKQEALPETSFQDDEFDVCFCTEVIPELDHRDFRLAIAELARIVKADGKVICSTPIDIYSEDALIRFRRLAETELKILHWESSYHALYIKFLLFLKAPSHFFKAWRDPKKREKEIKQRRGLSKWWFQLNSTALPALFWAPIQLILSPLVYLVAQSQIILNFFETVCHFFQHERGISHVLFIAKRRPLLEERDEPPLPDRPPFKREIRWE